MIDKNMGWTSTGDVPSGVPGQREEQSGRSIGEGLVVAGGLFGALAVSSCCIVPLVLFSLGVTGAWIGNLTALYPYKMYFLVPTAALLAGGFYMVYRKPKDAECEAGNYCASPVSDRVNKTVLWSATVLVIAAMAFPYIAPILLDY